LLEDKKYLKSVVLIPLIKIFVFGPNTKHLIQSELVKREKPLTQGSIITLHLRGITFDFNVLEAIPDNAYMTYSTKFDIPSPGPIISKVSNGAWWMY